VKEKNLRTGKSLRPATINRELARLKALFNFAIKGDLVLKNPVSRVKFYDEDNEQMRVLSYEEEKLYLSTASQPLRDVAILMLETGMGPEEVYRIKDENIDLHNSTLFNPYGKTKAAKRKVPLNKIALEIIQRRLDAVKGSFIFPSPDNPEKSVLKLNNAHYGALRRSGKEIQALRSSPHMGD
jgi:integrase